jgi:hypothetical protein
VEELQLEQALRSLDVLVRRHAAIVDSCIPMSSPTSRRDRGRRWQAAVRKSLELHDRLRDPQGALSLVDALINHSATELLSTYWRASSTPEFFSGER